MFEVGFQRYEDDRDVQNLLEGARLNNRKKYATPCFTTESLSFITPTPPCSPSFRYFSHECPNGGPGSTSFSVEQFSQRACLQFLHCIGTYFSAYGLGLHSGWQQYITTLPNHSFGGGGGVLSLGTGLPIAAWVMLDEVLGVVE